MPGANEATYSSESVIRGGLLIVCFLCSKARIIFNLGPSCNPIPLKSSSEHRDNASMSIPSLSSTCAAPSRSSDWRKVAISESFSVSKVCSGMMRPKAWLEDSEEACELRECFWGELNVGSLPESCKSSAVIRRLARSLRLLIIAPDCRRGKGLGVPPPPPKYGKLSPIRC